MVTDIGTSVVIDRVVGGPLAIPRWLPRGQLPMMEDFARGDAGYQIAEPIAFSARQFSDLLDFGLIPKRHCATSGVGQQFFREGFGETIFAGYPHRVSSGLPAANAILIDLSIS